MGVAFLDVGVYVTSLRTVKNLLVLCDVVKSAWFVAFQVGEEVAPVFQADVLDQEDPYKLTVLGRDPYTRSLTSADFFFADGYLSIIACDEEGIIRMFDYDPQGAGGSSELYMKLTSSKIPIPKMGSSCFADLSFTGK